MKTEERIKRKVKKLIERQNEIRSELEMIKPMANPIVDIHKHQKLFSELQGIYTWLDALEWVLDYPEK